MTRTETARHLLTHPAELGRHLGYPDLRDSLHGEWIKMMLTAEDDFTLQAHRGSYKTTCLTIAIAELMLIERRKNIVFLRKTDDDIAEVVNQVYNILSTPLMQQIYSALTGEQLKFLQSTKSELTTSAFDSPRGVSQLLGIGIGGSLTGKHADIIITDDIVNLRDRISRADREKTKSIYQELQNIKNRDGRIINTGTPWHIDDAFSLMPKPQKWDCYQTGLISKEQLEKIRNSMTPSLFAANYELQHIAQENGLFLETAITGGDPDFLRDGIAHIDAAYGGDDFTAFTCGYRDGDTIYLYGRLWQAHVDTVLDAILDDCDRLMCAPIYTEDNGDKGYLAKELKSRGYAAKQYHEKQNKFFKISSYLRKWWKNIVFIEGTDPEYIRQIHDYTEQAEHDDAPDSAACICRLLDKRG